MKVKTVTRFRDLEAGLIREIGEEFTVSHQRYDTLKRLGLVDQSEKPILKQETAAK